MAKKLVTVETRKRSLMAQYMDALSLMRYTAYARPSGAAMFARRLLTLCWRARRSAYSQETRKIILSLSRVSKVAPNGKQILKNVGLGMYLGAKIGVLGQNGAGKSSVLRILAGQDTAFDGDLELAPGIRVHHLEQEPQLDAGETVMDNIEPALQAVKDLLSEFEEVSMKLADAGDDADKLMARMDKLQSTIEAANGCAVRSECCGVHAR